MRVLFLVSEVRSQTYRFLIDVILSKTSDENNNNIQKRQLINSSFRQSEIDYLILYILACTLSQYTYYIIVFWCFISLPIKKRNNLR